MEQTRFFQLDIAETDHGLDLQQGDQRISIGHDQIKGVMEAMQRVDSKRRLEFGKKALAEMAAELKGKASVKSIKGRGQRR